jgi:hypothetical protein
VVCGSSKGILLQLLTHARVHVCVCVCVCVHMHMRMSTHPVSRTTMCAGEHGTILHSTRSIKQQRVSIDDRKLAETPTKQWYHLRLRRGF